MHKESYYICPECGELSTFSKHLNACSNGGDRLSKGSQVYVKIAS